MYLSHKLIVEPFKVQFGPHIFTRNRTYGITKDILNSQEAYDYREKLRKEHGVGYKASRKFLKRTFTDYCYLGARKENLEKTLKKAFFVAFTMSYPKELRSLVARDNEICNYYRSRLQTQLEPDGRAHIFLPERVAEALEDNCKNVLPLIIALNRSTKELKELFGKGLWKSLCKNSFTRNMYLGYLAKLYWSFNACNSRTIQSLQYAPSTLLKSTILYDLRRWFQGTVRDASSEIRCVILQSVIAWVVNNNNRSLTKFVRDYGPELHILLDTFNMLPVLVSPTEILKISKMDRVQLRLFHDNLAVKARTGYYETVNFPSSLPDDFTVDGISVSFIRDTKRLAEEGASMHHCVASYAKRCVSGEYIVVSLISNSGRSTLGLCKRQYPEFLNLKQSPAVLDSNYIVNQHTSYCNGKAPEAHVKLERRIEASLMSVTLIKEPA